MTTDKWEKYYKPQAERHRDAAEWILGSRCTKCKTTQGPFEFDHILRKTKSFTIGHKLHYSWEKVYQELRKCQLLCVSCHKEKTFSEAPPWNKGTAFHGNHHQAYTLKCPCYECFKYKQERNEKRREGRSPRPQTKELVHGTRAGYFKEKRLGITPCVLCKQANTDYTRSRKNKSSINQ